MVRIAVGLVGIGLAFGLAKVVETACQPDTPTLSLNRTRHTQPTKSRTRRYASERFMRSRDQFRSLDYPRVVAASEATFLRESDEVLGFVVDGVARAYPTTIVGYHHVVNDRLGHTALTVTF